MAPVQGVFDSELGMIKFALKILFVGLVVLLGFYFFMGSPEDKDRAKAVFAEVGDLFGELGNFIKAEKAKFDQGDYQDELEKIRELVSDIKSKATGLSSFSGSSDEAQAILIGQKVEALQRAATQEDLTDEQIEELNQKLRQLQAEAKELAESSGHTELPKLL